MSVNSDALFEFRASQCLLFILLNGGAANTNCIVSGFIRHSFEPTTYEILCEQACHFTTDGVPHYMYVVRIYSRSRKRCLNKYSILS